MTRPRAKIPISNKQQPRQSYANSGLGPRRLIAVGVTAPGPHSVNPTPVAASIVATAASATAAAHPNADAAAASATVAAPVAAMTPTAVMAASAAVVTVASATVAPVAAVANKLHHSGCIVAFFVEDVERCQANVCDFFLTEEDLVAISVA